jgi:spore coat polysaccharide biosynthesis protein SpsF (cytidylyltransferase family)
MLEQTVTAHLQLNADYVIFRDLPVGSPGETVSWQALDGSWRNARCTRDREHVVTYLLDHSELFRVCLLKVPDPLLSRPDVRITLDTYDDYDLLCRIARYDGHLPTTLAEAIEAFDSLALSC